MVAVIKPHELPDDLSELPLEQQVGILWRLLLVFYAHLERNDTQLDKVRKWMARNHDRILDLWVSKPGGAARLDYSPYQLEHLADQLKPFLSNHSEGA